MRTWRCCAVVNVVFAALTIKARTAFACITAMAVDAYPTILTAVLNAVVHARSTSLAHPSLRACASEAIDEVGTNAIATTRLKLTVINVLFTPLARVTCPTSAGKLGNAVEARAVFATGVIDALVDVRFAPWALVPSGADALKGIDAVNTRAACTRGGRALVNILLTALTCVAIAADAGETIHDIDAPAVFATGHQGAVVDVLVAVGALPAHLTKTSVFSEPVAAGAVLAGIRDAVVNVDVTQCARPAKRAAAEKVHTSWKIGVGVIHTRAPVAAGASGAVVHICGTQPACPAGVALTRKGPVSVDASAMLAAG
jgi:hypothetical protein